MAFRKPLYVTDSGHLKEYGPVELQDLYEKAKVAFLANPSVILSVVNTGGNLGPINETQVIASTARVNNRNFGNNTSTLGNISVSTVYYDRIEQTINAPASPTYDLTTIKNNLNTNWPVYWTDSLGPDSFGNLHNEFKPFSDSDFIDTFAVPVAQQLGNAAVDPLYIIADSNGIAGSRYARVSNTPVYSDNVADIANYTSGGLPEAVTQSIRHDYYLYRKRITRAGQVFTNVPYRDSAYQRTVLGTGLQFDVEKPTNGGNYIFTLTAGGTGYVVSDNFIVTGTILGGDTPKHDLHIYADSVGPTGDVRSLRFNTTKPNIANAYRQPVTHDDSGNLQTMTKTNFETMVNLALENVMHGRKGSQIRFYWDNGNQCGTTINDTQLLSPTSTRRNNQSGDNYYSQTVPTGGTPTIVNTHYLGVRVL